MLCLYANRGRGAETRLRGGRKARAGADWRERFPRATCLISYSHHHAADTRVSDEFLFLLYGSPLCPQRPGLPSSCVLHRAYQVLNTAGKQSHAREASAHRPELCSDVRTSRCMWKHLQPFGHRRTNSKRGKTRDRAPRPRANTVGVEPQDITSSAHTEISRPHDPQSPSPTGAPPPGPSTHGLMTTATVNNTQPQIPPTRASLKTWWNHFAFAQRTKREADVKKDSHPPSVIFGRPLRESLKRASVQISTAGTGGELYVWGQIPVVVAKCGLYLKENATELAGTFRVSGSNKRMRDLQAAFETPPRYGKDLDWKNEQYTPHDVASVFRRYLTQMPEPVIPHDLYHPFRDALAKKPFNRDEVIQRYKRLIRMLPDDNRFLLLYVLDLLSVFARKADKNLMTAKNLAVIFRPALLSHPSHELSPPEHPLSQDVLEFLIEHQDWFMLDISPPGSGSSRRVAPPPGVEPVDMMITDPDDPSWSSGQTGRVTRRRTTSERPGEATSGGRPRDADNLAPVYESTTPPSRGESVVTVSRSRTMPSRTARNRAPPANAPPSDDDSHPKVLKKHRRTSTQPQSRPGAG